jgi:hypothetical protein
MDKINHPGHYAAGRKYEPIDVIEDWELGFNLGNAVKYLSRAGRKENALEDLKKAAWYIDREIKRNEPPAPSLQYEELVTALADLADDWEFPHGLDDVVYYNSAEAGGADVDDQPLSHWEAEDSDWAAFWDSDDDYMWDPSLGPVELSDAEIQEILDRKDLNQFDNDEIVSTIDKRGFIIGVKADGTTCVLKEGTKQCEQ